MLGLASGIVNTVMGAVGKGKELKQAKQAGGGGEKAASTKSKCGCGKGKESSKGKDTTLEAAKLLIKLLNGDKASLGTGLKKGGSGLVA